MYKMKGVVPPMITPFDKEGNLDVSALEKLVTFLSDNVHGVFITGSYGCGAIMDIEERKKVTEVTLKTANGKIDVITHVGSTYNKASVELAKHAADCGVQAVAAVGPYYYKHNRDSILYFYEDLVKAVPNTPVYVYNNVSFQGYLMELDLIKDLKDIGVHGVKDATFDILMHAAYHRVLGGEDFDIVSGTEAMWLPSSVLGSKAFIPGLGNAFPEILIKMYNESQKGDYEACKQTQFMVNKMRDIMYLAKSTQLAVYAMLEIRGIIKAYPRAPFIPASESEKQAIKKELIKLGML